MGRRAHWIPLLALLVLCVIAGVLGEQAAPPSLDVKPWIGQPSDYSDAGRARIASAALTWAALAAAAAVAVLATSASCTWITVRSLSDDRVWCGVLLGVPPVFAGAVALTGWAARPCGLDVAEVLRDQGLLEWPIWWIMASLNVATAWVMGAMFAGASAVIRSAGASSVPVATLVGRLQVLLGLGAVTTVVGVLEIRAVYQLPAAAARGPAEWREVRAAAEGALNRHLDAARGSTEQAAEAFLAEGWVERDLKIKDAKAKPVAVGAITAAVRTDEWEEKRRWVVNSWLAEADEAARKATAEALESLARHVASFWGLLFTIALALVYLPAAAALIAGGEQPTKTARSLAMGISTAEGPSWDTIVKPFLRLLTALSPLLVGLLADVLTSTSKTAG